MVPRADICAIEIGAGLDEIVATMRSAGHSRLLVYRDTLDDVVGLVHIKDLLPFWGDGERFSLAEIMRPVPVVPPSMRVLDLLLEMRKSHAHMVAVVDEFGGTDGLATVEDLVVELWAKSTTSTASRSPLNWSIARMAGSRRTPGSISTTSRSSWGASS
jgi:magnesium and cobalt transporter